jgi:zinc transport system permease protein
MYLFFQDLISGSPLLLRSLAAMLLASIACGIIGCHVVLRRESYTVGAVSHSLLGGIGAALYLSSVCGWQWLTPAMGALAAALLAAVAITLCTTVGKLRHDAVLSAVWALGTALGISFVTAIPGYPPDMESYLFGSILLIAPADLALMALLDVIIIGASLLFHNRFTALAFNPEILRLQGLSPAWTQFLLQLLTAMTVVLLSQVVGIILCMALLILPAASAACFARRIPGIMLSAAVICFLAACAGVILSYDRVGGILLSPGATIIEVTGVVYMVSAAIRKLARHKS